MFDDIVAKYNLIGLEIENFFSYIKELRKETKGFKSFVIACFLIFSYLFLTLSFIIMTFSISMIIGFLVFGFIFLLDKISILLLIMLLSAYFYFLFYFYKKYRQSKID